MYYYLFYIFQFLAFEVSCVVTLKSRLDFSSKSLVSSRLKQQKSRLGLEAMMSRLGLGRFGPRSSSALPTLYLSQSSTFFCYVTGIMNSKMHNTYKNYEVFATEDCDFKEDRNFLPGNHNLPIPSSLFSVFYKSRSGESLLYTRICVNELLYN